MRQKKSLVVKRFDNTTDNNYLKMGSYYNFNVGATLRDGKGVGYLSFPSSSDNTKDLQVDIKSLGLEKIEGVAYFQQYYPDEKKSVYRLLVHGSDKKIYIHQMLSGVSSLFWLYDLTFKNTPIVLSFKRDDRDTIILTDGDEMKIWETGFSPYTVTGVPIITSMCMSDGVLFCTLKDPNYKIWYATNLDFATIGIIDNFSDYISLDDLELGGARKIYNFEENIYVFRDFGITKVNFSKNYSTTTRIYASNTKIYPDTISICGDKILFVTKDGLYSFNGVSVSRLDIDLFDNVDIEKGKVYGASLGHEYYLACRVKFYDNMRVLCENFAYVNNVLFTINIDTEEVKLMRGVDIKQLLPIKTEYFEKVAVVFNTLTADSLAQLEDKNILLNSYFSRAWYSQILNDDYNVKLVNKIQIYSDKDVWVTLFYDGKRTDFTTYKKGLNEFFFQITGREIKVRIESSEVNANVDEFRIDYYVYS